MNPAPLQARLGADGWLRLRDQAWRASIGRGGISAHKQEGDSRTPSGLLCLRHVLYRADRIARPQTIVRTEPIAPEDGWCDDPADSAYNCPVRLPYHARCEALWRDDRLYDVIGVLGWNDQPVRRGAGSAIFLHVATADYAPTAGCIALALPDLLRALALGLTAIEVRAQGATA